MSSTPGISASSAMPSVCGVPLCPNRSLSTAQIRSKSVQFHRLPREEPLRTEWCRSIGREDPGQGEVRVCSEHFDGDRDYRRIASILREAGQAVKRALLKPDAVPSLRLPPKRHLFPAKDPTPKRQNIVVVSGALKEPLEWRFTKIFRRTLSPLRSRASSKG